MRSMLFAVFVHLTVLTQGQSIFLSTFDGAEDTTREWSVVNDPVMGGVSSSSFRVDAARGVGVWEGEVEEVPFLKSPGFSLLQSPGLHKTESFPDLSSTNGLTLRARVASGPLHAFDVFFGASDLRHWPPPDAKYMAAFNLTAEFADHFVPWSDFQCSWRGQTDIDWCPETMTQLSKVNTIGIGTHFPGENGEFVVEVVSISASVVSVSNSLKAGRFVQLALVTVAVACLVLLGTYCHRSLLLKRCRREQQTHVVTLHTSNDISLIEHPMEDPHSTSAPPDDCHVEEGLGS